MGTNQQRREAAKRKLDRQLARRAERARRRKVVGVGVTVGAVVIVAGVVVFLATRGGGNAEADNAAAQSTPPAPSPSAAQATSGPCGYQPTPQQPAPDGKQVGVPKDPEPTPAQGTVQVALHTGKGDIGLTLDRAKAECTVQSIEHLVRSKFYDQTPCHRLTTSQQLKVLQCGDPTGTGSGGPGYTIPDEPPENLEPAGQGQVTYPRGTIAMAKTKAPDSGGSQFFLVYADSTLPPKYTVFGTIDEAGLAVLDTIAAGGVKGGQSDGAPATPVTIGSAELAG